MNASPKISPEMKTRYIERRRADLEALMDALASKDLSAFSRIGHQLKGNASTFGFDDLEKVAIGLEDAGNGTDSALARQCVLKLHAWIEAQATTKD